MFISKIAAFRYSFGEICGLTLCGVCLVISDRRSDSGHHPARPEKAPVAHLAAAGQDGNAEQTFESVLAMRSSDFR
jgi:hypothetical protein